MIVLPPLRPAYLKSFPISLGLLSGLVISAIAYWLDLMVVFPFVVIAAVGFSSLGLLWPKIMSQPYLLWNVLAHYFARGARLFLMGICFYIILLAVGRAGTTINLARPQSDESLWLSKNTLSPDTYAYEFAASVKNFKEKNWLRSYLYWARISGHAWAFFLVPLLAMLSAVEINRDRRFPAGVYTLF